MDVGGENLLLALCSDFPSSSHLCSRFQDNKHKLKTEIINEVIHMTFRRKTSCDIKPLFCEKAKNSLTVIEFILPKAGIGIIHHIILKYGQISHVGQLVRAAAPFLLMFVYLKSEQCIIAPSATNHKNGHLFFSTSAYGFYF